MDGEWFEDRFFLFLLPLAWIELQRSDQRACFSPLRTCGVLRAYAYCSGDVHRTPKAKGALAGCVITAVLGMLSVVWVRW